MFSFTLFVAGQDADARALSGSIEKALADNLSGGSYKFAIVDVFVMPEKALESDVFATPTLMRELPLPILKLVGDIARTPSLMAMIRFENDGDSKIGII